MNSVIIPITFVAVMLQAQRPSSSVLSCWLKVIPASQGRKQLRFLLRRRPELCLFAFLTIGGLGGTGCQPPYQTVYVRDWRPYEIEVPSKIRKVAIVNRSAIPEAERKRIMDEYKKRGVAQGALQGALTGGLTGVAYGATTGAVGGLLDEKWLERAPQNAIQHLHLRLKECERYEPLMAGQELKWMGSSDGSLPPPLPMDSIQLILKRVPEAHAIIALETLLPGGSPQKPEILAGFRMYDAKTGKVIDEVTLTTGKSSTYYQGQMTEAYVEAVEGYVHRICACFAYGPGRPLLIYVKGSPNLQQAKAAVIGRRWTEAIALWEKDANAGKGKAAKRAAYNLALLYDAMCEIEKADEWYSRAVSMGLGKAEYEEWGRTRRTLCQKLNSQIPKEKRSL
ncbi:MAG: DUF6340 family protein [Bacteroidia bacterium]|nr:DUF6340 family protein [Bacteroidia bacterium]MDW8015713.1 DUF6340 family protein [Bacteroidia bacterium]